MLITQLEALANHRDRLKWNEKYLKLSHPTNTPHPILSMLESLSLPQAPILELACGLSGNVLPLARLGYNILAVDISEIALSTLDKIIKENQLESKVTLIQADLAKYEIPKEAFALVLGLKYWDKAVFNKACQGVINGGVIAWETFNKKHLCYHPTFRSEWCLEDNEPTNLLPSGFDVVIVEDFDISSTRRLIAKYKKHKD